MKTWKEFWEARNAGWLDDEGYGLVEAVGQEIWDAALASQSAEPVALTDENATPFPMNVYLRNAVELQAFLSKYAATGAQGLTRRDAVRFVMRWVEEKNHGVAADHLMSILAQSAPTEPLQGTQEPVAEISKIYGTCWRGKQLREIPIGTVLYAPVARVDSSSSITWLIGNVTLPHGTKLYAAPAPNASPAAEQRDECGMTESDWKRAEALADMLRLPDERTNALQSALQDSRYGDEPKQVESPHEQRERVQFEQAFPRLEKERDSRGHYDRHLTRLAWQGWLARAILAASPAPAQGAQVPRAIERNDPLNPYRRPVTSNAYREGWNACRSAMSREQSQGVG